MTAHAEPSCDLKPTASTDLGTRYVEELAGQLRCFDRVILQGTLIDVAHPGALLVSMQPAGFRTRDLTRFAQPITGQVRERIRYQMADNAFSQCADWQGAPALADQMDPRQLHRS